MKKLSSICLFVIIFLANKSIAQITVESESATLVGGPISTTYKSTQCVQIKDAGSILYTVNIAKKGYYKLEIFVASPDGYKEQALYVNNSYFTKLKMNSNANFFTIDMGAVYLNQGSNTIEIRKDWGWAYFDKIVLTMSPPVDYSKTATSLINPNADTKTKELYQYLRSQYGKNIISGQTSFWDSLTFIARKQAKVRAFDFQHYTQGYAYLWKNGAHALGWEDDGTTKSAIDWYNNTKGQGIVSFQWHWHPPMNSQPGKNTFYTNSTTFDASRAVVVGNQEYTKIIEDIDSIASQLKKLQKAGIPVLWRPLHEAAGNGNVDGSQAWFWWGAKGATVSKQLWDIMYDRLTNYHKLNNLIWVWSTPEDSWYLGNTKLDMFGYDSYPNPINHNSQKAIFSQMNKTCNGEKLVAMTENGPIPDINKCIEDDAMWSYFLTWSGELTKQNDKNFVSSVYQHNQVIALENTNFWDFAGAKEGWTTSYNINTSVSNNQLWGNITAADPQILSSDNLMLFANQLNWLVVAMQNNTTATTAEFFWTTQSSPNFDGTKKVTFNIVPNDSKISYYIIDLSNNPAWTGEIKQLRLDPSTASSGNVKIELIKLTSPNLNLVQIPGTVELENYNKGGLGNGYNDSDFTTYGAKYRTNEGVDIDTCSEGSYNIGWTTNGEWVEYLVNVSKTANYDFVLRTASATDGNQFHLEVDGQDVSGVKTVNTLGGLQNYFDIKNTINLSQGKHVLRLVIDKANGGFNLNKMMFTEATITRLADAESSNLISIYPNPVQHILNVQINNSAIGQTLYLLNAIGEMVLTKTIDKESTTIDIQNLSTGIYILKVGNSIHKVIITK